MSREDKERWLPKGAERRLVDTHHYNKYTTPPIPVTNQKQGKQAYQLQDDVDELSWRKLIVASIADAAKVASSTSTETASCRRNGNQVQLAGEELIRLKWRYDRSFDFEKQMGFKQGESATLC